MAILLTFSAGRHHLDLLHSDDATEVPELPRLRLWFDRVNYGRLRQLIDVLAQVPPRRRLVDRGAPPNWRGELLRSSQPCAAPDAVLAQ